jgi:hypothetical protein
MKFMPKKQFIFSFTIVGLAIAGMANAQSDNMPMASATDTLTAIINWIFGITILLSLPGLFVPIYRYSKRVINKKSWHSTKDEK